MDIAQILNDLIEKINTISREKSIHDICRLACRHIVELFHFDYAVVSLFNFRERKIVSKEGQLFVNPETQLGRPSPVNWVEQSEYEENADDILVRVLSTRRNIKAVGRHVFDEGAGSPADKITSAAFNKAIFDDFEHEKIARFYIPIIYRDSLQSERTADLGLGVIEIGIKETFDGEFSCDDEQTALKNFHDALQSRHPNMSLLEKLLQLYTDNFAQPCYAAIIENESKVLLERLMELKRDNYDNLQLSHENYATDVIKELTTGLRADWGIIAFKTFNSDHINFGNKGVYFSDISLKSWFNEKEITDTRGPSVSMIAYVCNEIKKTYYSADVDRKGEHYFESINFPKGIVSEMVTPIFYDGEVVGVIDLYSEKPAFFNSVLAAIVEKCAELFVNIYMIKKRQNIYNSLIKPTETWNNSSEVHHQLVKLLSDYYYTGNISLWVRNADNINENEYSLEQGFPENKEFIDLLSSYIPNARIITPERISSFRGTDMNLYYDFDREGALYRFCQEKGFRFYIALGIRINNRYDVFVNIFSRLDIFRGTPNKEKAKESFLSREFDFLSQISIKAAMSLQNLRITEALANMTLFEEDNNAQRKMLERIVASAQKATGADIVSLFPFYAERNEIIKKDCIQSDGYIDSSEQRAVFADVVFRNRSKKNEGIYTFDTADECVQFLEENGEAMNRLIFDRDGFRTTNNINSTCAVRLDFGKEPVGVMFFNYTMQQDLKKNNNLKQMIRFFSTFAAHQIYLNRELNFIRQQNKELDTKYALKQEELEKMIPLITRTEFYLIVEGVSHIMKNALEGLRDDLDTINYLSGRYKEHFENKKTKIKNSLDLVEDVLTVFNFRDKQNQKDFVSIPKIIQAIVKFFKVRNEEIEYATNFEENLPSFFCFKAEFSMVIYNLVYNSITAINKANAERIKKEKGLIEISVRLSEDEDNFVIEIRDNGIGIRHELDEEIYKPNFSTKDKGTGLGLYYVKQTLKEGYNGKITHKSRFREYTKFTITIPLSNNY